MSEKMKLVDFIKAPKDIAMVIGYQEYKSVRSLLQKYYRERHINFIDDHFSVNSYDKILLCNLHAINGWGYPPMMLTNAVTFIDRLPFRDIDFTEG